MSLNQSRIWMDWAFEVNKSYEKILGFQCPFFGIAVPIELLWIPNPCSCTSFAILFFWKTIFHKRNRETKQPCMERILFFSFCYIHNEHDSSLTAETVWSAVCLTCRPAETNSNLKSGRFSHQPGAKTHLKELASTSTWATAPVSP